MMTKEDTQTRFSLVALGLVAALLLALGPNASAEEPTGFAAGGAGSTGTLPVSSGTGGIPLPPFFTPYGPMLRRATKPAASLNGLASELDDIIAASYSPDGSGWFQLSPVAPGGTLTITYYGNVVIELDRQAFQTSQATLNLSVAPSFHGGVASVQVAGHRRTSQVLRTGSQSLQLHRLIRTGLVDQGLALKSFDKGRTRVAGLELTGHGARIRIEQSH